MAAQVTCPNCEVGVVKEHCASPTCGWSRCAECRAVIDLEHHRGVTAGDQSTGFTF